MSIIVKFLLVLRFKRYCIYCYLYLRRNKSNFIVLTNFFFDYSHFVISNTDISVQIYCIVFVEEYDNITMTPRKKNVVIVDHSKKNLEFLILM